MDDRAVVLMSGSELLSALDVLHDEIAERQARQVQILERLDDMGYANEIGAHDTARLLAERYRLDPAEAGRWAKLAKALHKYPVVAAAIPTPGNVIADGEVVLHLAQAEAIVSALEKIPASANVAVEDLTEAELRMVEAARNLGPGDLRKLGVQVRNVLDTDGAEPREDAARQREDVWMKRADGGVKFGGYLAAENAEALETVIQAGAKPHKTPEGDPDPRSRGKRQADALVDALNIALSAGDLPARGGIKPHITVTIDLNALLEAGKNATGNLVYGDGLSAGAIRRLACDAGIIPAILGSDSQLLDVGREHRFVTTGLRDALNLRDQGCVVCNAPPIYCDAHHLTSWLDHGDTSLTNLVLLCRVHHTALHLGHWTITITNNQVHVTTPTWATCPPHNHRKSTPPSTTAPAHPAATSTDPWPTDPPPATPPTTTCPADAPLAPTATDTCPADAPPAATATDTCPPPAAPASLATCPSPSATGTESTSPTPTRPWPHTNDVTWITPEETAALAPWVDAPDDQSTLDEAPPPSPARLSPDLTTTRTLAPPHPPAHE